MTTTTGLSAARIREVEDLIRPYVRRTPVVRDGAITLKIESLQHAGSFKTRGAFANLLSREVPPAGVVAASGGNHGAAVAYAAHALGIPATIFVPTVSSPAKMALIRRYGAELIVGGERYSDAYDASVEHVAKSGAIAVHAFDAPETILGQGTLGKELEEQDDTLDAVLVPVGGGGLIAGVAAWYAGRADVIGVEPEGAPTLHEALKAGRPVDAPTGSIAADSLAPRRVGAMTFEVAQRFVSRVILVSDDEIRAAREALWQNYRLIAEPGALAPYAAVLSGKYTAGQSRRTGLVVSGGNTIVSWLSP